MAKIDYFSSKSIFGQLIALIDDNKIKESVKKHDSNRYVVNRFKSKDRMISISFYLFAKVILFEYSICSNAWIVW